MQNSASVLCTYTYVVAFVNSARQGDLFAGWFVSMITEMLRMNSIREGLGLVTINDFRDDFNKLVFNLS